MANLGSSLRVPNVQELAKEPVITVAPRYVRPDQDPISATACVPSVPVIDTTKLLCGEFMDLELAKLHSACKDWGFSKKQIVTNGAYRSIEHRATVNSVKERLSMATFLSPKLDGEVGPSPSLDQPK